MAMQTQRHSRQLLACRTYQAPCLSPCTLGQYTASKPVYTQAGFLDQQAICSHIFCCWLLLLLMYARTPL